MTSTAMKLRYQIVKKREKQALIHIAKKAIGLSDDDYGSLLVGAAGIESTKDLEYEDQFNEIMKAFKRLGFTSEKKGDKSSQPQRKDSWGCSEAQRAKIEVMWKMCARNPSDRSLRAFIKRIAKVDHPAFLRPHLAQKVIIALEKMTEQTVYKPKAKKRLTP